MGDTSRGHHRARCFVYEPAAAVADCVSIEIGTRFGDLNVREGRRHVRAVGSAVDD
ncbi:hypothetical protein ACIO3S_07750 [Nocardioides sp. NPDC087217]|uniref:hypothetical protein n=1 Tax=Nocardioides sp. NPDC087217 TaxID=3364335 RepID=UPI0038215578